MKLAVCLFLAVTLVAQNRDTEKQAALGERIFDEALRNTPLVKSKEVQDYVARLGAKLAANKYSFSVVGNDRDGSDVTVLPGGYVLVPVDALLSSNDETEFALRLARAMARPPSHWFGPLRPLTARPIEVPAVSISQAGLDAETAKEFRRVQDLIRPEPHSPPSLFGR